VTVSRLVVTTFTTSTSTVTLIMVFAIQHTAGREQTAVQRKLDELLRAVPGAAEGLILLEEAQKKRCGRSRKGSERFKNRMIDPSGWRMGIAWSAAHSALGDLAHRDLDGAH